MYVSKRQSNLDIFAINITSINSFFCFLGKVGMEKAINYFKPIEKTIPVSTTE